MDRDDAKHHEQTDAEIVEEEKARTQALEYGQDQAMDDAVENDGDAVTPAGPVP